MKKIGMLLVMLTAVSSQAGIFDLDTDPIEIANAMAHCPAEVSKLLKNPQFYISHVGSRITQESENVSIKGYDLTTMSGGGFERPVAGNTLSIELTVTQPPKDTQDIPSKMKWSCHVFKK